MGGGGVSYYTDLLQRVWGFDALPSGPRKPPKLKFSFTQTDRYPQAEKGGHGPLTPLGSHLALFGLPYLDYLVSTARAFKEMI